MQGLISSSNIKGEAAHNIKLFPRVTLIPAVFFDLFIFFPPSSNFSPAPRRDTARPSACAPEQRRGGFTERPAGEQIGFGRIAIVRTPPEQLCNQVNLIFRKRPRRNKQLYE